MTTYWRLTDFWRLTDTTCAGAEVPPYYIDPSNFPAETVLDQAEKLRSRRFSHCLREQIQASGSVLERFRKGCMYPASCGKGRFIIRKSLFMHTENTKVF